MAKLVDLLSVAEARHRVLENFHLLESEETDLLPSLGRSLAESVVAAIDVPPFANSSMDGFALYSVDVESARGDAPVILPVSGNIAAGSTTSIRLEPGKVARIMTGAPLPTGADAVIPFEDVEDKGDSIAVGSRVARGACVRPAGNDVRTGDVVLPAGEVLGARHLAAAASVGVRTLQLRRRPRVAIMSTGDELIAPGVALAPGQIYNSNSPMLAAAVIEAGGEVFSSETVPDDRASLRLALVAAQGADVIVTSGGASVGDFDYVKDVIGDEGEIAFWRVRLRPGKPLLLGRYGAVPVVGLPGNPTSSLVTFELFVRPALRLMLGLPVDRPAVEAIVDEEIDNRGGRETYARIRLEYRDSAFHVSLSGQQDSAMIWPLARADGLLRIPADCECLRPGDRGTVLVFQLPAAATT